MFDLDSSPILPALLYSTIRNRTHSCTVIDASSKVLESAASFSPHVFPRLPRTRTHRVPVIGSALMSVIRPSGVWCPTC